MNPDTTPAALHSHVAGSSFYAGMRVLPRPEREAMYAVYGFCRLVDDIADEETQPRPERAKALDQWRRDIDALYAHSDAGKAAFLNEAVERFALKHEDFHAVIDGMAMDIKQQVDWPDMATLDLYCDRVASAVGRLSVRVFGMDETPGIALAHHLGRALQLTNILRDIDEDAVIGRVYLPREALLAAGVVVGDIKALVVDPRVDAAARQLAATAHQHYGEADAILAKRPHGHLIAPRMMAAVYAKTLRRTEEIGWKPPRVRVKTNKLALIGTLARLWLFR
ncbi:MAG: presqualene diphosphate synthase HpnD [Sphingomonadaceae bacterium]